MSSSAGRVIVIGASAGGVAAMRRLSAELPADLPAPVLLAQHIGTYPSLLPELLSCRGSLRARFGIDGEVPEPGTIHVAPPDQHMLVEQGRIRLWKGPKEQFARPAINPLFRSAALEYRERAIGVILTGMLDDGTAGLAAIERCGGVTVVQDPAEAAEPSMPASALKYVSVDHVARLEQMPQLLMRLASQPGTRPALDPPPSLLEEHAAGFGDPDMRHLGAIGTPSAFTCPDCGGALFELDENRPVRYACHTGHAHSLRALASVQEPRAEAALWTAVRALQEQEAVLRRLAAARADEGLDDEAQAWRHKAEQLNGQIQLLRRFVERD